MPAYAIQDAIEARRDAEEAVRILREEAEAGLSRWFEKSIKAVSIQKAVIADLGGKADEAAINRAFDACDMEEKIAEFIRVLAEEIAHHQTVINNSFID